MRLGFLSARNVTLLTKHILDENRNWQMISMYDLKPICPTEERVFEMTTRFVRGLTEKTFM